MQKLLKFISKLRMEIKKMETSLQTWDYLGNEVRTIEINSEPWFVLADVCKALELSTPSRVAERLEKDEVSQTHAIN